MRNSKGVPSQLGLPAESLGLMPEPLIGRSAFLSARESSQESAEQTSWKITA